MFGRTCLGTWRGGDLAVKCVRVAKDSEASSFLREVAALAAIRHPNIMQFFGAPLAMLPACQRCCLAGLAGLRDSAIDLFRVCHAPNVAESPGTTSRFAEGEEM
jgi:hypothetical protein